MQFANRRVWYAWIAIVLLHACQSVDSPFYADRWRAPELVRARSSAEFERQIEPLIGAVRKPKTIFIGVYGGNPPLWEKAAWFNPQRWPSYQAVDLQDGGRAQSHCLS